MAGLILLAAGVFFAILSVIWFVTNQKTPDEAKVFSCGAWYFFIGFMVIALFMGIFEWIIGEAGRWVGLIVGFIIYAWVPSKYC